MAGDRHHTRTAGDTWTIVCSLRSSSLWLLRPALAVLVHGLMDRQRLKMWLNHADADAEIASAGV